MEKNKTNPLRQQVASRAEQVLKIMNKQVYVSSGCPTFLRIDNDGKNLECNNLFTILQKKAQEFMVTVCLGLTESKSSGGYTIADASAFKAMVKKYPKTPKAYWYRTFLVLMGTAPSELNIKRCKSMMELIDDKKKQNGKKSTK